MNPQQIKKLLRGLKTGRITEKEAFQYLKSLPFKDLGFAKFDHHRILRRGMPEVILGQGKTREQVLEIVKEAAKYNDVLVTKTDRETFKAVKKLYTGTLYNEIAKTIILRKNKKRTKRDKILVLTAGTSDIPVAEEAAVAADFFGNKVEKVYDVGVAGIHRLFAHFPEISKAKVIIVVAGMEGALASVVSGLVAKPVIAVPTSCGYGASFKGITPLLAMLNSCSPGIGVVNIDNGFGAGYLASLINK
ncbi:MAG: nickel pincer cofactor biosynthesis protein LarB [Candidatus Nealsonbacteria bacterium]|nr:MAG: nickel pincer cofactor biosynthesis protein LarB [Candidatus Nealsonbacteria bacterium]